MDLFWLHGVLGSIVIVLAIVFFWAGCPPQLLSTDASLQSYNVNRLLMLESFDVCACLSGGNSQCNQHAIDADGLQQCA